MKKIKKQLKIIIALIIIITKETIDITKDILLQGKIIIILIIHITHITIIITIMTIIIMI